MHIVKNWQRNAIGQNRLSSLMIFSHSDTIDELNIVELMSLFAKKTKWRKKMFSCISYN